MMRSPLVCAGMLAAGFAVLSPGPVRAAQATPADFKSHIDHIVIVFQENWGFDALYGKFPGANGYASAVTTQTGPDGGTLSAAGPVLIGGHPDPNFPTDLPARPFDLSIYIKPTVKTGDPVHNFYIQQAEIDGGKMDRYLAYPAVGTQGGLTMGYWDATDLPEGKLAKQYVLADDFHQSAFGGSFLNNMWAACACTPQLAAGDAPAPLVERMDALGNPVLGSGEGRMTPDYYVVNTSFSTQYPQFTSDKVDTFVPPLDYPTLGDRLTEKNVSWKFYAGGLNDALAGHPDKTFQPHHQSYLYFRKYAPGTPGAAHIVDDSTFLPDLTAGTLPSVAWIKPIGANNEHPGYANLMQGQLYVARLIGEIQMSSAWKKTLIVIVYDEAGGHFDHVAPMPVDRWGPSTRVPALFVSPFARHGIVDHTSYEMTSVLRTIEMRFGLDPLGPRDANAPPILAPFDFRQNVAHAYDRRPLGDVPPLPVAALGTGDPAPRGRPVTEIDLDD
jgi:phospholipase C